MHGLLGLSRTLTSCGAGEVAPSPPTVLQGALGYWHDSWDPFFGSGLIIFHSGLRRFLSSAAPGSGRSELSPEECLGDVS